jgi:hypothetical protein
VTDTRPDTRIVDLPVAWLRDHTHEALPIYALAMGYDPGVVAGRYGYAIQHTDRPGFRAVGAFAATGVSLAASRKMTPTRWVGVLMMVCAIAHVFESHFYYTEGRHFSQVTWALAASAAGVFWLFCSVLFEDEPRIPAWRSAIPGAALTLWLIGAVLPASPVRAAVWWSFAAYSLVLHIHVMLLAWRGWRIGLVERRRHLRAPIAAAGPFRGRREWSAFEVDLVVPATGCDAQLLRLETAARAAVEQDIAGRALFDDLRVVRAPG